MKYLKASPAEVHIEEVSYSVCCNGLCALEINLEAEKEATLGGMEGGSKIPETCGGLSWPVVLGMDRRWVLESPITQIKGQSSSASGNEEVNEYFQGSGVSSLGNWMTQ